MELHERINNAKKVLGLGRVLTKDSRKDKERQNSQKHMAESFDTEPPREVTKAEYYSCIRKERYRTMGEATYHMHVLMTIRPQTKLRVYECPYCLAYHLTSKPLHR